MPKKIKVKLLPKVHRYLAADGKHYFPGDILEVEAHRFRADFMEKVDEPKPAAKKEKVEEEAPTAEDKKDKGALGKLGEKFLP